VAASPDPDHPQQLAVAIQTTNAGGCTVEVQLGGQGAYKPYPVTTSGSSCSSISYDANGNLWAATDGGIWVLSPGHSPAAVGMSAAIQPGDQILAMRMAPDAVRAALLVSAPDGNRLLLLAAVSFRGGSPTLGKPVTLGTTGLTLPVAISWYDAYHLAVLATEGIYEIPLTGGAVQQPAPQLLSTVPLGAATLTTDGTELVVGTNQGQGEVFAEAASAPGSWGAPMANGINPVYPG
jgi:hypothetical protein